MVGSSGWHPTPGCSGFVARSLGYLSAGKLPVQTRDFFEMLYNTGLNSSGLIEIQVADESGLKFAERPQYDIFLHFLSADFYYIQ